MTDNAQRQELPKLSEFCLEVPLYKIHDVDLSQSQDLHKVISAAGHLDSYCVNCGKHSVFNCETTDIGPSFNFKIHNQLFHKKFTCSRVSWHEMHFFFQVKNGKVFKIGQTPSHADLSLPAIQKYRAFLDAEEYSELHRAVGLVAHGVGIGAFVYLRRIFEKLIEEAHIMASKDTGWVEDTYNSARTSERIGLLKDHLPSFLIKQKALYGILSKGIHELSEQDCLAAFPVVKLGIELILDEHIEVKRREEKLKEASKEISLLQEKHKYVEGLVTAGAPPEARTTETQP